MDGHSRLGHWVLAAILFYSIAGSSVLGNSNRPKNVQVSLRARWPGTPILLEAGELLSKEWKNPFWDFIDTWIEEESQEADLYTVKDCFKKIVRHGQSFLSQPLGSMLELSLSLRLASPRLVIYRQLAKESLTFSPAVNESHSTENVSSTLPGKLESPVGPDLISSGRKCCWADTSGTILFEAAKLLEWIRTNSATVQLQQPELFDFDHVYLNPNINAPPVILYGAVGMSCFKDFHVILSEASKQGKIKYVLRPVIPSGCESKCGQCGAIGSGDPLMLGGYGVELALKNMEYKAMDDSDVKKGISLEDPHTEDLSLDVRGFTFSRILERKPDLASQVMAFRDYILSSTISDTLNVWELKDLGHQTAQRILLASDPLQSMQEISHNFLSVVSSLSRTKLNVSIKDEIIANQQMFPPGKSLMALNGALISVDDIDLYTLIDAVHQELSLADQFLNLQIPQKAVTKLLLAKSSLEEGAYRVDFRSPHVHYINNLEQDAMYKRWRSDIHDILMPVFPGQLRYIRKNIFHAVYVFDPASSSGREAVELMISLYENGLPVRFGVILFSTKFIEDLTFGVGQSCQLGSHRPVGEDTSSMIIRLFLYLKQDFGIQTAFQFLRNVNKPRVDPGTPPNGHGLEIHEVEGAFIDTLTTKTKSPPEEGLLVKLEEDQTFREESENSSVLVYEMGLAGPQCRLLLNGLVFDSSEEALMGAMNDELPRIQEHVYYGRIYSHTDVLDKFLTESGVKRHNPLIYDGSIKPRYVSLPAPFLLEESVLRVMDYLHSPGTEDEIKPVTHVLVIDVRKVSGWKLLHEGIRFLLGGAKLSRLGVLFSAKLRPSESDTSALAFIHVFRTVTSLFGHKKHVLDFLYRLSHFYGNSYLASCSELENGGPFLEKVLELAEAHSLPLDASQFDLTESALGGLNGHLNRVAIFSDRHLGIAPGLNAVMTNGRVFPVKEKDAFSGDDLRLLESVEFRQKIKHISEIVEESDWPSTMDPDLVTSKFISDSVMLVSSSMSSRRRSSENARFEVLNAEHSAVVMRNENSSIHIDAVVDPLSSSGQKLSSLLQTVRRCIQPSMRVVLNPLSSLVDLPLKNFYRYVVPSADDAAAIAGPRAFFANVPPSKTLTMNLDVPEPWLVESVDAVHDLDNILLEKLGDARTLTAVFELEALLLTGHCSERDHDAPRGLQLILGTKDVAHEVDTLVMANLGYWQMKVSPGVWYLQLSPGRSSELYILKDGGGVLGKCITMDDLRGKLVHLEVERKDAGGDEKLLVVSADGEEKDGRRWNRDIFRWASGLIGGRSENGSRSDARGRAVNIFSIASGHLYERFLRIMMLSVLKNTRRPVKFWFIKNYLSPQFKDVIPRMADEYGFEFELVTYKWPAWLHKQKEKQRIIWAYKILFLDVIFPLSLEKVIFVDADQVVRADMGELYDMNTRGSALAYTPFCDNNREMDGYRFWRQGFWKEHLRGKPYHISALYVVDLVRFRETAAGDNLRVLYETLSKDPNSLSNLDQDLPNYAQHAVPIFSLPQEWLWCESWCGNSTKSQAKTIDLCNNPMTKEPKLQGARRIVPEWSALDAEAGRFTDRALRRPVSPPPAPADDESSSEL